MRYAMLLVLLVALCVGCGDCNSIARDLRGDSAVSGDGAKVMACFTTILCLGAIITHLAERPKGQRSPILILVLSIVGLSMVLVAVFYGTG